MTPFDESLLRQHEKSASLVGRRIEYFRETTSTNDLAHERAIDPCAAGLVVVADHQSRGRGQQGRVWNAPPGAALLFSIVLLPKRELTMPHFLTAWAASAIAESVRGLGLDARIKWPNDILVAGRKLCGILVERRNAVVVGVGLNVSIRADQFPDDLRLPATSLETELGLPVDRTTLFLDILARLDDSYQIAERDGPYTIWRRWPALAENLLDQFVVAATTGETLHGRLIELRPDRGARIRTLSGTITHVAPEQLLRIERQSTVE